MENKKSIVFDAGPIISLTTNNLLWILELLKQRYGGAFIITDKVRFELIERPLTTKKFKFEALQVMQLKNAGVIDIVGSAELSSRTETLLNLANTIFKAKGNFIKLLHAGEVESLAAAIGLGSELLVVDERTTRLLIEDPVRLQRILSRKLNTDISVNKISLKAFQEKTRDVKIIRSAELITVAFKMGLLDKFLISEASMGKAKEQLLDSILWGVKLHGCSVSEKEIKQIVRQEI